MRLDLVKTAGFAVMHFAVGFGVTFALTGSVPVATGVALIEPAVNTVAFFFHERLWQRLTASRRAVPVVSQVSAGGPAHAPGAWGLNRGALAAPPK
jgi:uncharacterized membrane protein